MSGSLDDIFHRITMIGIELTRTLLDDGLKPVPQDDSKATYCKRRSPADSEITLYELEHQPAVYLYNKVRMLQDPYPNAYWKTVDGRRLLIKSVEMEKDDG